MTPSRALVRSAAPFLVGLPLLAVIGRFMAGWAWEIVFLTAGINVILAVSLNVVNGFTGQFSLGHAGFAAVGAYTAAKITTGFSDVQIVGLPVAVSDQIVFALALVAGMALAALAGFVVGMPSLRLRGDYLAIVTLGFNEIIRVAIENTPFLGQATGISGLPLRTDALWVGGGVIATVAMAVRLGDSTHGRALLAIREDEIAAEAMGVDTTGYKIRAFVISSAFAGLAGGLLVHLIQLCTPRSFTFVKSIEVVVMVVLGGMGSVTGSIIAALVLSLSLEGLRAAQQYRMVMYSLLLIGLMLSRPAGLLGTRELWDLFPRLFRRRGAPPPGTPPARRRQRGEALVSPAADAAAPVLEARKVTMQFGGLRALADFDLALRPGELVGLIGPNGAGKTTAFNAITGVYAPSAGEVLVSGARVNGLRPHQICARGVARTFQNIRLFKEMTALDNVKVGLHHGATHAVVRSLLLTAHHYREERRIEEEAHELLRVMGLSHRAFEQARNLPYGEQRRLEIARALATRPKVLCLDEPAAGMNASEKVALMDLIRRIRDQFGLAILVIEHDMRLVMGVSERLVVLDYGVTIAQGRPGEVRQNPKVIEAYLGDAYLEEKQIAVPPEPPEAGQ